MAAIRGTRRLLTGAGVQAACVNLRPQFVGMERYLHANPFYQFMWRCIFFVVVGIILYLWEHWSHDHPFIHQNPCASVSSLHSSKSLCIRLPIPKPTPSHLFLFFFLLCPFHSLFAFYNSTQIAQMDLSREIAKQSARTNMARYGAGFIEVSI
jgi:hypothetical protein